MKKLILILFALFAFTFTANAQLKAYNFQYHDEFGGQQNCYMTFNKIATVDWDERSLTILFQCYESRTERERGTKPRNPVWMKLDGNDFLTAVLAPIASDETGKPFAISLSDKIWSIALTNKFISDYSFDSEKNQMVEVKKSLTDLGAQEVDLPIQ